MSTEDKRRRLRRLVPSWSFLTCLRRPLLFRLAGKEGGDKGRWVTVLFILPLNSSGPQCFGLAFHSIVTSCVSDYAPPDTGVSDLQLVAVEQLPSIEGTVEIRMGVIFLRGRFYLQAPKPSPMRGRWHGGAVTDEVEVLASTRRCPPHQSPPATASPHRCESIVETEKKMTKGARREIVRCEQTDRTLLRDLPSQ